MTEKVSLLLPLAVRQLHCSLHNSHWCCNGSHIDCFHLGSHDCYDCCHIDCCAGRNSARNAVARLEGERRDEHLRSNASDKPLPVPSCVSYIVLSLSLFRRRSLYPAKKSKETSCVVLRQRSDLSTAIMLAIEASVGVRANARTVACLSREEHANDGVCCESKHVHKDKNERR